MGCSFRLQWKFERKLLEFTELIIDYDCFNKSCKDVNLRFCGHLIKNITYMSSLPSCKKPWCVALQYCATYSNTLKQPRYSISRYYGRQHILMIIVFGNIQKRIRNMYMLIQIGMREIYITFKFLSKNTLYNTAHNQS